MGKQRKVVDKPDNICPLCGAPNACAIAAGRPPIAEELLTRPPIGLDELLSLAEGRYRDHRERQALLAEWSRAAHDRYSKAREIAREQLAEPRG